MYHKTKKNNKYQSGKFCHIYRPKLIDANGKEIWANLNISSGIEKIMTITVDNGWLQTAKYPVIIDPTFGYTTKGGTAYAMNNTYTYANNVAFSSAQTIETLEAWVRNITELTTHNMCMAYYTSDGTPNVLVQSSGEESFIPGFDNKRVFDITDTEENIATHFLSWQSDGGASLYVFYDGNSGFDMYYQTGTTYGTFPNPFTSNTYNATRQFSIWANYSEVSESDNKPHIYIFTSVRSCALSGGGGGLDNVIAGNGDNIITVNGDNLVAN